VLREKNESLSIFISEEAKKKKKKKKKKKLLLFSREEMTRSERHFLIFRAFFDRLRCLVFFFTLGRVEATRLDRCCSLNFSFFFLENFLGREGGSDFFFFARCVL
jgi:hypothetical protein